MPQNPLLQLHEHGQSVWLDNIDRTLLSGGGLAQLVERGEVQGVTSNPTIFQKAIQTCNEYDAAIRSLSEAGQDTVAIYDEIAAQDIRDAADVLAPVFDASQGRDGYVSIEVSPTLADDLEGTVAEAKHLFGAVGRPNVMIKVPGTAAGVAAMTELIAAGINVNATLLFSPDNYEQIARAYIAGLQQLAARGAPLERVASVASFFVSRVDTVVDRELEARLEATTDPSAQARIRGLLGQAAIANAKIAYQRFKRIFAEEPFPTLQHQGARVQRPLWASTSTKNPAYRDVVYIEELIGPDTVNTVPPATLEAFRDHGRVRPSLEEDVEHACRVFDALSELGIDMGRIYADLQTAGIEAFAKSFEGLLGCIRERQVELGRA